MIQNYLLLLAAFTLARIDLGFTAPSPPAWVPWAAALALPLLAWTLGTGVSLSIARRFQRAQGELSALVRTLLRTLLLYRMSLMGAFLLVAWAMGWRQTAFRLAGDLPVLSDGILFLPYVLAAMASSHAIFPISADPLRTTRSGFVLAEARALGVLSLLCVLGGALGGMVWGGFPPSFPAAGWGAVLASLVLLAVAMPLLLRIIWRVELLPPGDLDDRLRSLAERAGFRYRAVYIWDTGGQRMVNAAVSGVWSRLRYVFLTRDLLDRLDTDEVEAVFSHEMGHIQGRHGWVSFCVLLAFVLDATVLIRFGGLTPGILACALGAVTVFFGVFFILLSRVLEREADLLAAVTLGSGETLSRTLEKVAVLNGDAAGPGGAAHGTVEHRIRGLTDLLTDGELRSRFQWKLRIFKAWAVLLLVAGCLTTAPFLHEHAAAAG